MLAVLVQKFDDSCKKQKMVLLFSCMLFFPGCLSLLLPTNDAPPRYTLKPLAFLHGEADITPVNARLIIADPKAEAVLNTSNIALATSQLRYEYVKQAAWSDRISRLISIFFIRSFENTNYITTVGDRTTLPVADYILQTDVRAFQVVVKEKKQEAVVEYYANILDRRNRNLGGQLFSATKPVNGKGTDAIVIAINAAIRDAASETMQWSYTVIQAAEASSTLQPNN